MRSVHGVTAAENTGDFAASTFWIGDVFQVHGVVELAADVGIGESSKDMVATEESLKYLDFIAGDGIQRPGGALGSYLLASSDAVQGADGISGIADLGQSVEIAAIGGQGHVA